MTSDSKLTTLFKERYHGAGNHRGVLYHALYGTMLGLGLNAQIGEILNTEGYEDLELENPDGSLILYQLKCYDKKLDYGDIESIFASFANVIIEKNVQRCCIVTTIGFPDEVENWQTDAVKRSLPAKLRKRITNVAKGNSCVSDVLAERVEYIKITTEELTRIASEKMAATIGLSQASHESFLHALCVRMVKWSGERRSLPYTAIAGILSEVKTQFDVGLTNPAIENGFVVPLVFKKDDPQSGDFYEGRAARPGHIAANRDVPRIKAMDDLKRALERANVAAVISSSGQGKSALALRHLANYTTEGFAYEVKVCRTTEDASAIAEFVRFRLRLGLGVSLLVDNLSRAQGSWTELAASLAGENVKIVLTAREEDWKLFTGDLSRLVWQRVTPTLELNEARQIFGNLSKAGALHPSMKLADEAYEKVNEAKLLIEYIYLLTQGELLQDRLKYQIEGVEERDKGALICLQVVSLADQMNMRVEVSSLLRFTPFQGDPQRTLQRLEGEYLTVTDGLCSGLHPVRSQHLVRLLHPYGIEETLKVLLDVIETEQLPEFVYSVLARTDARIELLIGDMVKRCRDVANFEDVWKSAYAGSEVRHAQECKILLNEVEEMVGRPAVNLFPLLTLPLSKNMDTLDTIKGIMDTKRFEVLKDAIESVPLRDYSKRPEVLIAREWVKEKNALTSKSDILMLSKAFWLAGDRVHAQDLLNAINWEEQLLALPLELASRAAFILQQVQPEEYGNFVRTRHDEIIAYLLQQTRSLAIRVEGDKLIVSFIVDPYVDSTSNDQAVSRMQSIKGLLPYYEGYATNPVHPLRMLVDLPYDDAYKDSSMEFWYSKEITDLNHTWVEALEVVTASDSLVGWEWRERAAILAAITILESFAILLEKQDADRTIYQSEAEECARRYQLYESSSQARYELPSTLTQEQKSKLVDAKALYDTLNALLPNVHEELLAKHEGDLDRQQVILHCLRDVYNAAQSGQNGLSFARQTSGLDEVQAFAKRLQDFVKRLYRTIERRSQIKHGQRVLDSMSPVTADLLYNDLKKTDASLAQRIKLARTSLLYTPEDESKRFQMPSWLFTLEVDALESFVEEALRACMIFACAFDSYIGNFIVVPVRHGARISRRLYKASAPKLRDVVESEQLDSFTILPLDESREDVNAIFGLESHKRRFELDLLQPFIASGERLAFARAASKKELASPGALNPHGMLIREQELGADFANALVALKTFQPDGKLVAEWGDVMDHIEGAAESIEGDPDDFLIKNIGIFAASDRYLGAALKVEDA